MENLTLSLLTRIVDILQAFSLHATDCFGNYSNLLKLFSLLALQISLWHAMNVVSTGKIYMGKCAIFIAYLLRNC